MHEMSNIVFLLFRSLNPDNYGSSVSPKVFVFDFYGVLILHRKELSELLAQLFVIRVWVYLFVLTVQPWPDL